MIQNTSPGNLTICIEKKIARITFGHPAGNSFPGLLLQKLTEALETISENEEVAVVILQSEGNGAFCAGASFDELVAIENLETGKQFFSGFANVINAMRRCNKLILGRIQGKAVGGGVGLAAACDYAMATQQSAAKLSEFTIGIGPFVIAPAVERKIGKTNLAQMTLDATTWHDAQWCEKNRLYTKVFENTELLDEALNKLAEQLVQYNLDALSQMKKVLWEGTEHWDELLVQRAEISGELVLSDFTKKALASFKK